FHGLLGDVDSSKLADLSLAEKGPFVLRMLGASEISSRGAATVFELGQTVTGWPQLASEVTLGAVTTAAAVRRFGLEGDLPSGRIRFDVEEILSGLSPVEVPTTGEAALRTETDYFEAALRTPPPEDPPLE